MNGIHDLGGMDGFGRVEAEPNEPVFHAPWEGRVLAMVNLALGRGLANVDAFRHAIECMDPVAYLSVGYYGRWLTALETLFSERGIVRASEIEARLRGRVAASADPLPELIPPPRPNALRTIDTPPRFSVGQVVRARNLNPHGHTRLPRYVRGKHGTVARVHPAWVFPDTNAHGLGEHPQYVYAVRFAAADLWGAGADPEAAMHVDLFETYLEPEHGS
ncbi:MAG TPA: nitrile hydratase subunit beta [Candidatus Kryptonia bacterium]|nr:nitrile hydratase subunit beta [Candidatus Kryptonia bacterium]